MKVRFQNNFHVPGFSRRRFVKGICDVPESMRDHLPSTAVILGDDYVEPAVIEVQEDERLAADFARTVAESTSKEALARAGLGGFEDNGELDPKVPADPTTPVSKAPDPIDPVRKVLTLGTDKKAGSIQNA